MSETPTDSGERFTRLLLENRKRILGFVLSLMPSGSDADDVFQEACAAMWRKFDQFEPGTNFVAWALQVARYEVMDFYAREKRRTARLSDATINAVLERYVDLSKDQAAPERVAALEQCLGRLDPSHLELIRSYYHKNRSVIDVARRMNVSTDAIYKRLTRIRAQLFECIHGILARAGES